MLTQRISMLAVCTLMAAAGLQAQWNISFAAVRGGIIEHADRPDQSFYPEVQLGGLLGQPAFEWSVYWAHWEEDAPPNYMDALVYSYSSHIAGARVTFYPARSSAGHWPLPLALWGGAAHEFIHRAYAYGSDGLGTVPSPGEESSSALEAGLKLYLPVEGPLELSAEAHQYFGIGGEKWERTMVNRRAYSLGLGIRF